MSESRPTSHSDALRAVSMLRRTLAEMNVFDPRHPEGYPLLSVHERSLGAIEAQVRHHREWTERVAAPMQRDDRQIKVWGATLILSSFITVPTTIALIIMPIIVPVVSLAVSAVIIAIMFSEMDRQEPPPRGW